MARITTWKGWIEFRDSKIHGLGAFALQPIEKQTEIIQYVGERISKAESLKRCEENNECIFTLDDQWDLDGKVSWNPARFINHSCTPNCEALCLQGEIWIVSSRTIHPGEELSFNYGYDLEDYRENPCSCGTEQCLGYMVAEEFAEMVRRQRPHHIVDSSER